MARYRSFRSQTLHYFARPHQGLPAGPIDHPAAWLAPELRAQPQRWQHRLGADEVGELEAALEATRAFEGRLGRMRASDFPLPKLSIQAGIWRSTVAKGRGFVLLRGLPVQRWTRAQLERAYWGLGLHLGRPGGQNQAGDLLGHVRDERLGEGADVRQYRTREAIPFHCDAADAVALLCVRPPKEGGQSRIASSVSVFNEIQRRRPDLVPRLFEPFLLDTHAEQGLSYIPITPLAHFRGQLRTFMHPGYFRSGAQRPGAGGLDARGGEVLDLYERIANAPEYCLEMEFEPGDVQLLSNHTIVHSRGGYEDHPALEQRRHLLRLWLSFEPRVDPVERWLRLRAKLSLAQTRLRMSWAR